MAKLKQHNDKFNFFSILSKGESPNSIYNHINTKINQTRQEEKQTLTFKR